MFDELLQKVAEIRKNRRAATAEIDQQIKKATAEIDRQISELTKQRDEINAPFQLEENTLIAEWKPRILQYAATYTSAFGKVSYRKGAKRVSYDWKVVDTVRDALKDVMPNLAEQLGKARSESMGEPSFGIDVGE